MCEALTVNLLIERFEMSVCLLLLLLLLLLCCCVQSLMADESVSDHEASAVSLMINTSSYERDEMREPGYEADHEFSSDDCAGN